AEWYAPEQSCESAGRGWLDPRDANGQRVARTETDQQGTYRVCEIPQLEGDALESCREDPTCEGCGSGWCQSSVVLGDTCTPGEIPARIRFTGGAVGGTGVQIRVRCALQG